MYLYKIITWSDNSSQIISHLSLCINLKWCCILKSSCIPRLSLVTTTLNCTSWEVLIILYTWWKPAKDLYNSIVSPSGQNWTLAIVSNGNCIDRWLTCMQHTVNLRKLKGKEKCFTINVYFTTIPRRGGE